MKENNTLANCDIYPIVSTMEELDELVAYMKEYKNIYSGVMAVNSCRRELEELAKIVDADADGIKMYRGIEVIFKKI